MKTVHRVGVALALCLTLGLTACSGAGTTDPTNSSSGSVVPSVATASPETSSPQSSDRFRLECVFPDGSSAGSFSSWNEAWSSTNYVRIDHCSAHYDGAGTFTLTPDEAAIADIAARGLPDATRTDLYLRVFAACVRVPFTNGSPSSTDYPVSILEATRKACPDAPQAAVIERYLAEHS